MGSALTAGRRALAVVAVAASLAATVSATGPASAASEDWETPVTVYPMMCLEPGAPDSQGEIPFVGNPCNQSRAQTFLGQWVPNSNKFLIRHLQTGTCLTLDPSNPTVSGTRIYAVNCDWSWRLQQFTRRNRPVNNGIQTSAGLCVQAQNPQSIGTNVPIIQKTCNDSTLDQIAGIRLPPRT
ncbi:hypothetical protein ACIQNG_38920 [Streptomyces sp. NPDC091377]|uniref:hypothetical protein n=1 Tax=unclassified Streptomyces TaxID=2593676 RepID=UPI00381A4A18